MALAPARELPFKWQSRPGGGIGGLSLSNYVSMHQHLQLGQSESEETKRKVTPGLPAGLGQTVDRYLAPYSYY